jgi:hypothetical protein
MTEKRTVKTTKNTKKIGGLILVIVGVFIWILIRLIDNGGQVGSSNGYHNIDNGGQVGSSNGYYNKVIDNGYYNICGLPGNIPDFLHLVIEPGSYIATTVADYIRNSTGHSSMNNTGQMPGAFSIGTWGNGWSKFTMYIHLQKDFDDNCFSFQTLPGKWIVSDECGNSWSVFYNSTTMDATYQFAISPSGNVIKPLDSNAISLDTNTPLGYSNIN